MAIPKLCLAENHHIRHHSRLESFLETSIPAKLITGLGFGVQGATTTVPLVRRPDENT